MGANVLGHITCPRRQAPLSLEAGQLSPAMLGGGRGLVLCSGVLRGPGVQWEHGGSGWLSWDVSGEGDNFQPWEFLLRDRDRRGVMI